MPKKKSRTHTVDGTVYRWMLTGNWGSLHVVVESDVDPGQVLQAEFDAGDKFDRGTNGETIHTQKRSVTPEDIAELVRFAIQNGWNPSARNLPAFTVDATRLRVLLL